MTSQKEAINNAIEARMKELRDVIAVERAEQEAHDTLVAGAAQ